jgi:D-lyxose ketol-isomerase
MSTATIIKTHEVIKKVWGTEEVYVNEPEYCFKILRLNRGFQSSLHYHKKKKETFLVRYGTCTLEVHKKDVRQLHQLSTGDSFVLQPGQPHRFWVEATAADNCVVYEVSTHHDDDDVVRLEESRRLG